MSADLVKALTTYFQATLLIQHALKNADITEESSRGWRKDKVQLYNVPCSKCT